MIDKIGCKSDGHLLLGPSNYGCGHRSLVALQEERAVSFPPGHPHFWLIGHVQDFEKAELKLAIWNPTRESVDMHDNQGFRTDGTIADSIGPSAVIYGWVTQPSMLLAISRLKQLEHMRSLQRLEHLGSARTGRGEGYPV